MIVFYDYPRHIWTVKDSARDLGFSVVGEIAQAAYKEYCTWFNRIVRQNTPFLLESHPPTIPAIPRSLREFLPYLAERQWHRDSGQHPDLCPMRIWFAEEAKRAKS